MECEITQPFRIKTYNTEEIDKIFKLTHEVLSVMKYIKLNRADIQLNIFKRVNVGLILIFTKKKQNTTANETAFVY